VGEGSIRRNEMNPLEKFDSAVQQALAEAFAAGATKTLLDAVLMTIAGIDPEAARDAVAALDGLIDGEDDDLAEQLRPAREILRRLGAG
jgi:hypothetical protein